MKKIVLLAAVALFAATVIGCGPTAGTTTKTVVSSGSTTNATGVK